jgi:quinol-cytochrome oxidoreductase complex cytochrome b subunit
MLSSHFIKGFLLTGIPATAVSVFSAFLFSIYYDGWGSMGIWLIALITLIVTSIIGVKKLSSQQKGGSRTGTLAGIVLSVIVLVLVFIYIIIPQPGQP